MKTQYLLVDSSLLPDVFVKVVEAKQLVAQGKAKNMSEAAELVDISRSTFYKYKDGVFAWEEESQRRIATLHAELEDRAGVLSNLLTELYACGANILTINQNIPVDGVAPVSLSIRTDTLKDELETTANNLKQLSGVVSLRLLTN